MSELVIILRALSKQYLDRVLKAPGKSTWNLGKPCLTKNDIRRDYLKNIDCVLEVAIQEGDQEAMDLCRGAVNNDLTEIENSIRAKLKGAKK